MRGCSLQHIVAFPLDYIWRDEQACVRPEGSRPTVVDEGSVSVLQCCWVSAANWTRTHSSDPVVYAVFKRPRQIHTLYRSRVVQHVHDTAVTQQNKGRQTSTAQHTRSTPQTYGLVFLRFVKCVNRHAYGLLLHCWGCHASIKGRTSCCLLGRRGQKPSTRTICTFCFV
jgi:hypothetical protein